MPSVILHLGSNKGDLTHNINSAYDAISNSIGTIIKISKNYHTKAWGKEDQADFINSAILIKTGLTPYKTLEILQKIEVSLGRKEKEKWGPRIIDIDIIFYGDLILKSSILNIPHQHFAIRKFVLDPVNDIAPDLIDPISIISVSELKTQLETESFLKF